MSAKGKHQNASSPRRTNPKELQAVSALSSQYEEKIRPGIDLIDSLRALGVEKDLALPAIAVIGDQSSGKSSVLEALSGVALPRGSGIVTRCPLELKLKKIQHAQEWKGKIVYSQIEQELTHPSQVEGAVVRAQNAMAGKGLGISHDLISLEISSPDVPDLTLIDLPGIARVAVGDQPKDIGQQILTLIKKYINKQQTINLVVVPSNVDIATTEALKMAQEVDPKGERTLGILTKPDLVDKGTETEVVDVVRNQRVPLKKGYMIVKCRGQRDINDNVGLAAAIQKEKEFFEEHNHFRTLLEESRATIPLLAEKLTQELIEHIHKSLPTLGNQIKRKLEMANVKLQECGQDVPETTEDQMIFLVQKIKHFNQDLINIVEGEEVLIDKRKPRLFTILRQYFNNWQEEVNTNALDVRDIMKDEVQNFENKYRGKELPGFINYKTFEAIVKQHILLLKSPALEMLKDVAEVVRETFTEKASQHFSSFYYLLRAAQSNIEDIKLQQEEAAESLIHTQFKLERVVYCQDNIYSADLRSARVKPGNPTAFVASKQCSMEEMSYHLNAYFSSAGNRLSTQIPLIIQSYVLQDYVEKLQNAMLQLLQDKDQFAVLLQERNDASSMRITLKERIKRLTKARQRLAKFPI
ncbi:interferon-induced GTP-binding protein Mx1-like [Tiliqua scincoides]|uniref:interferon-induced GTP-binding protein Mx1-like n=1 Tax=Tiliqua scincoides TaxID=71010 RepID=UPI003462F21C